MPLHQSILRIALPALLLAAGGAAFAHSEHGTLYVATTGVDAGDCREARKPCKSLMYAISRALKGEQIRVAAGTYEFDRTESVLLVGEMVDIAGGYTTRDGFARRDPEANATFIVGPSTQYRDRLAARGLTLVQDQKGMGLEEAVGDTEEIEDDPRVEAVCSGGQAGPFPCHGVNLLRWVKLSAFSTQPSAGNDIWGFIDLNDRREYAIIGLSNGTGVVEVTKPRQPRVVGTIPGPSTTWRDIKVSQRFDPATQRWRAYAYGTADAVNQGLQVIDLTNLPESVSLAATYREFASAHNLYMSNVNYATGVALPGAKPYIYIAGSNLSRGAFRVLDISDPINPVEVTPPPGNTQYVHDGTSMLLTGARAAECANGHDPCEVFIDFNENTVDLWDVTEKAAPVRLSSTGYPGASYTHSGWWSEDTNYVFIQDELDESNFGVNTQLRTLDIHQLRNPFISNTWVGPTPAIDHNGYAKGNRYYMSNYRHGLTILDISDANDPQEVGNFDTYPANDSTFFNGAWGVYPFLPSGNIVVSDIERGLFILREQSPAEAPAEGR
jgi:choice-of-anchor B domain-containing protein